MQLGRDVIPPTHAETDRAPITEPADGSPSNDTINAVLNASAVQAQAANLSGIYNLNCLWPALFCRNAGCRF